jgi:hypothetical protein
MSQILHNDCTIRVIKGRNKNGVLKTPPVTARFV